MANHNHKLSFHMDHTPSSLRWDPPGSATPPPQKPGSVPFLWEEKPGMPKKNSTTTSNIFKPFSDVVTPADSTGSLSVRSLELPPRLVAKMKAMQMQRHVDYEGPDLMSEPGSTRVHVTCHSFSYYREGKKKVKRQKKEAWFWPKRKKNPKSKKLGEELMMMPTVPKLSRNRSLTSVSSDSHHTSHFWASIRENFKQVVSWRKQGKNDHC